MPAKSKAQMRMMFVLEKEHKVPKGTGKHWANESKKLKGGIAGLPEHVHHKKAVLRNRDEEGAKAFAGELVKQADSTTLAALAAGLGVAGGGGAAMGAPMGAIAGLTRGNTPEGIGRGIIRGGTTGVGAGLGALLTNALLAKYAPEHAGLVTGLAGAGLGGLGGYALGGAMLGDPVGSGKRKEEEEKYAEVRRFTRDLFKNAGEPGSLSPGGLAQGLPRASPGGVAQALPRGPLQSQSSPRAAVPGGLLGPASGATMPSAAAISAMRGGRPSPAPTYPPGSFIATDPPIPLPATPSSGPQPAPLLPARLPPGAAQAAPLLPAPMPSYDARPPANAQPQRSLSELMRNMPRAAPGGVAQALPR